MSTADKTVPPAPKSRLLFVDEIRREFFGDRISAWWIRRNLAPDKKIRLGHSTIAWYEHDVVAWIASRQGK
jgi:hypothetical protein